MPLSSLSAPSLDEPWHKTSSSTCAINGGGEHLDNPRLPITPEQILAEIRKVAAAGASVAHVHALRVGNHLIRWGNLWALDIPAEDTKTAEPIEFLLSATQSARIDLYLEKFRNRIPQATTHNGLWVSNKGQPMDGGTIYDMVRRRTRKAFGFGVSLHRFWHAVLTFWSNHDPKNIRGGKDLLGHRSFGTTEKFYVMTQSRVAGRVLADAWKKRLAMSSWLLISGWNGLCLRPRRLIVITRID
jgi:integrase